jgi:hypothetical protein
MLPLTLLNILFLLLPHATYVLSALTIVDISIGDAGRGDKGELQVTDKSKVYQLANTFYDFVTDGYEWAWGSGFHFSHRLPGMSHSMAQLLHESRMASFLRLQPGMQCLDVRLLHPVVNMHKL